MMKHYIEQQDGNNYILGDAWDFSDNIFDVTNNDNHLLRLGEGREGCTSMYGGRGKTDTESNWLGGQILSVSNSSEALP